MTSDDAQSVETPEFGDGHHVSWFAPERPVSGTVYVRGDETSDGDAWGGDF